MGGGVEGSLGERGKDLLVPQPCYFLLELDV